MSGITAEHFKVHDWLGLVSDAVAQLPEFQRDVVWKPDKVVKFLDAILEDRPVGCLLVLKVRPDAMTPFSPRPVEGASPSSDRPIEYLILDGQQRITALWKSLMEVEETRRYFLVYAEDDPDFAKGKVKALSKRKWQEDPKKCLERGVVPVALLKHTQEPADRKHVTEWIDAALADGEGKAAIQEQRDLEGWISRLSEQLRNFDIPHLLMPDSTSPSQAINTFIESNTSSLKLKKFDIAVAETLAQNNDSLRAARQKAWKEVPGLARYVDLPTLGELVLKVGCLRSGLDPVQSNYNRPDVLKDVADGLDEIIDGIGWVVQLLEADRIWDSRRLPSVVPFRVLPALFRDLPVKGSSRGAALKTARAYLWRAFLTDRYRSSAANLLKSDFDGLRNVVSQGGELSTDVPIWGQRIPSAAEIKAATWPTRSSLPKALLAITLRRGARDIGTGEEVKEQNIDGREYHHLFPKAYLARKKVAENASLAMNCVLVRARTNREASDKSPLAYLKTLAVDESGSKVGKDDVESRLETHLVRRDLLGIGKRGVESAYGKFLSRRAKDVLADVEALVNGRDP